jgi:hypothetical protein
MKRGGSKMGYTEQFNLLSPCYKDGEQPAGFHMGGVKAKSKPTKKGKATKKRTKAKPKNQRGGSSCYASPSVSEMGIVDKPASNQPTASELAWDNRMKGGGPGGPGIPNANEANGANRANGAQPVIKENTVENVAQPANITNGVVNGIVGNNSKKNTQLNNISTYLNKVNDVVFSKDTNQNGFSITVQKTKEDHLNPKNDEYKIIVIKKKNNTPSMSVLADQTYSTISQTVRDTSIDVFPLKKTVNNKNTAKNKNNSFGAVNYGIPNNNSKIINGNAQAKINGNGNGNGKVKVSANVNSNGKAKGASIFN